MKLRGFRVELSEVEAVLAQLGVASVVLCTAQQLVAFLVAEPREAPKVREKMAEILPYDMVPEMICFLFLIWEIGTWGVG